MPSRILLKNSVVSSALPAGTPPNSTPWEHIDLTQIRESVNALLGYRPVAA